MHRQIFRPLHRQVGDPSRGAAMTDGSETDGNDATPDDAEAQEQEQAVKARLIAAYEQRKALHASGRSIPAPRPEKFAFPIGIDDEGNPFPVLAKTAAEDDDSSRPESR